MPKNTVHTLKSDMGNRVMSGKAGGVGKSKIPREEWARIRARRDAGETMSAISRDYGVTPPAISYIIKHTPAADGSTDLPDEPQPAPVTDVALDAPAALAKETTETLVEDAAACAPKADAETAGIAESPAPAEPTAEESQAATAPAKPAYSDPLAKRLSDAATYCSDLVEAAAANTDEPADADAIGEAIHSVRRALVAIEIDMSKRERKPHPQASGPAPSAAWEPLEDEQPSAAANDDHGHYASGTVKFYRADKGFGFVTPDDGSGDVYIPSKVLNALGIDNLQKGQRVKLRRRQGAKGPEVEDLRLLAS